MSWKSVFTVKGKDALVSDGRNFATKEEALDAARNATMKNTYPDIVTYGATEVPSEFEKDYPVNYRWEGGFIYGKAVKIETAS